MSNPNPQKPTQTRAWQQHLTVLDTEEKARLRKLIKPEKKARSEGFNTIAGVDEAGRGPLAGPVVAAACIIPEKHWIAGIDDSKKLLPEKRFAIFQHLINDPKVQYGVGILCHEEVDRLNILQASLQACLIAISNLPSQPDLLLFDGHIKIPHPSIPCHTLVGGDQLCYSIAAASIIAKSTRDHLMREYHKQWPFYGFNDHKGYATEQHLAAITQYGPCPIHRKSFSPFRKPEAEQLLIDFQD